MLGRVYIPVADPRSSAKRFQINVESTTHPITERPRPPHPALGGAVVPCQWSREITQPRGRGLPEKGSLPSPHACSRLPTGAGCFAVSGRRLAREEATRGERSSLRSHRAARCQNEEKQGSPLPPSSKFSQGGKGKPAIPLDSDCRQPSLGSRVAQSRLSNDSYPGGHPRHYGATPF